jgi:hypothetical protein
MILIPYAIHIWFEYFPINFICNFLRMFKAVKLVGLAQKICFLSAGCMYAFLIILQALKRPLFRNAAFTDWFS